MRVLVFASAFLASVATFPLLHQNDVENESNKQLAANLSDSLFTLVKLQPQVRILENKMMANPSSTDAEMDYADTARRFVDDAVNTTTLALTFLQLNHQNYTKRPLSAQEVFNIPQKMILAELIMSMQGDKSQMIEISNDLVTHLNGARCALIKKINGVVAKINKRDPTYPRIMMEFHEMTKLKPVLPPIVVPPKPVKPTKIRAECEQAKKKHLSRRLLKYFCGAY